MADSEMVDAAILESYADALRRAGYDVFVSDVARGRLAHGGGVREAVIDAGGRLRLTETSQTQPEQSRRVTRQGARFRVLHERRAITTITTEVGCPEELPTLLDAAAALLAEARAKPR